MNETMSEINTLVQEALKLSGSKKRFNGVVRGYDQVGTTVFISGDDNRKFLAFRDSNCFKFGDAVTFRIDGLRAIDIQFARAA